MAVTDNRCPSCASAVSPHDARCGGCGVVLGVDNVCERCHALAPAVTRGGRLVCSACGSERMRQLHTVVESEGQALRTRDRQQLKAGLFNGGGALLAAFGLVVGTLVGLFGQNAFEVALAVAVAVVALAAAALAVRQGKRVKKRAEARERFELEQRLLGFAYQRAGVVTSREVARHLNISVDAADAMLDSLVTAQRADMDVTDEGEIMFSFKSARAGTASERSPSARAAQLRPKIESS